MQYRKLGNTDIDVSVMALGCWPFAGGGFWGDQDDAQSIATVQTALNSGINFFDTAPAYEEGASERVLGRALEGKRHQAIIATKVSDLTADGLVASCETSLKNLRTDYVDLYQIHWPNHKIPIETSWRALEGLVRDGKVRALGVSNFGLEDMADLVDLKVGRVQTNQLPYSLLWRAIEYDVLTRCRDLGIGLICYSPLAQGLLTGRYATADEVPEGLARTRLYSTTRPLVNHGESGCEEAVFHAITGIREVSEQIGAPMGSVALAWVRQQVGVTSFLVGARTPEELEGNLPSLSLDLDAATTANLERLTQPIKEAIGRNADMWMAESRMR